MTPEERRKAMEERLAKMSPEERKQFEEMRAARRAQGGGGGQGSGGGENRGRPDVAERRPRKTHKKAPQGPDATFPRD